jgi:hypothetical protein
MDTSASIIGLRYKSKLYVSKDEGVDLNVLWRLAKLRDHPIANGLKPNELKNLLKVWGSYKKYGCTYDTSVMEKIFEIEKIMHCI